LKAKLLAEGADYPRTYSFRVLLEILSELVPEDKRSSVERVL
jgi:HEPN domain-containing protein